MILHIPMLSIDNLKWTVSKTYKCFLSTYFYCTSSNVLRYITFLECPPFNTHTQHIYRYFFSCSWEIGQHANVVKQLWETNLPEVLLNTGETRIYGWCTKTHSGSWQRTHLKIPVVGMLGVPCIRLFKTVLSKLLWPSLLQICLCIYSYKLVFLR